MKNKIKIYTKKFPQIIMKLLFGVLLRVSGVVNMEEKDLSNIPNDLALDDEGAQKLKKGLDEIIFTDKNRSIIQENIEEQRSIYKNFQNFKNISNYYENIYLQIIWMNRI